MNALLTRELDPDNQPPSSISQPPISQPSSDSDESDSDHVFHGFSADQPTTGKSIKSKSPQNDALTKRTSNSEAAAAQDDDITQILAHHPCTPRPHKLPYHNTSDTSTTNIQNRGSRKQPHRHKPKQVNTRSSNTFDKGRLKHITTPRPESVGNDPTDDEDDDDEDDADSEVPLPVNEDDVDAVDDYMLKKKEKWEETQKGPSYHAYTTDNLNGVPSCSVHSRDDSSSSDDEEDDFKKSRPSPTKPPTPAQPSPAHRAAAEPANTPSTHRSTKKTAVRGAEYFPTEELCGRYEFVRYLGHGAYGYVAEGRHLESGRKVAIKKILRVFHNRIDAKRLLRELRILRILRGLDSIVQLVDILPPRHLDSFTQIILVFEFIDTDLSKLIQSDQYFTKLHVQYMLYQILLGLKCMHSLHVFHRDLKPANILVNEDVTLKVCDFGLARCTVKNLQFSAASASSSRSRSGSGSSRQATTRVVKQRSLAAHARGHRRRGGGRGGAGRGGGAGGGAVPKRLTQHVVTRWYRAPEVILLQQKREHLGAVDMWSVGCIFGELLQMLRENMRSYQHRKPIFPGQSSIPLSPPTLDSFPSMDQLTVIFGIIGTPTPEEIVNVDNDRARRFLMQMPKCLPSSLKNMYPGNDEQALSLLRGLLQFDVEKRITVEEALSHPFIQHVRDEQNEQKFQQRIDEIQQENDLDFEFEDTKMKIDTFRELIIEEVLRYKQNRNIHQHSSNKKTMDFV